jgi:uncharacterized protein (DUF927 family)
VPNATLRNILSIITNTVMGKSITMKGDDSANYGDEIPFSMENKLVVLEVILAIASPLFYFANLS